MAESPSNPTGTSPLTPDAEQAASVSDLKREIDETRRRLTGTLDRVEQRVLARTDPINHDAMSARASDERPGVAAVLTAVSTARRAGGLLHRARAVPQRQVMMALGGAAGAAVAVWWLRRSGQRTQRRPKSTIETVLLDVDGTLIDSNGAHASTWARALGEHGVITTPAAVRPLIGMGGDKLLPAVAKVTEDSDRGQAIAKRKQALFTELLPTLQPTSGARALVQFLRDRDVDLVIATSAGEHEMHALLERAGVADLIPVRTSKDDASESKPDPDIVHAALTRARARSETTVMIGDTPYDVEAARRAGVRTFALRSGGYWSDADLRAASAIFDDPAALLSHLQEHRRREG